MKGKAYKAHIWHECRKFYVYDDLTAEEISEIFNGNPTASAIRYHIKNEKWDDEKKRVQEVNYSKISPAAMANKVLEKIYGILSSDEFSTKDADKLAKLQATLSKLLDSKYQIPMLYQMLTGFTVFVKENHPKAFSRELIDAARDYKNHMLKELGK